MVAADLGLDRAAYSSLERPQPKVVRKKVLLFKSPKNHQIKGFRVVLKARRRRQAIENIARDTVIRFG